MRTICERPEPLNKLTREEKQEILDVVHFEKYTELPPSQIVPRLANQGIYITSNSRLLTQKIVTTSLTNSAYRVRWSYIYSR